jgi:hypothetical protein
MPATTGSTRPSAPTTRPAPPGDGPAGPSDPAPAPPAAAAAVGEPHRSRPVCRYCAVALRQVGLHVVSTQDDLIDCPDAPVETCASGRGTGCGTCEGYGARFGRHTTNPDHTS